MIYSMILLFLCGVLANSQQQWMPAQFPQQQFQFPQQSQFPQQQSQFQQPQQSQFQIPQQQNCYDTAINCLENSYFCNQPYYESTMRNQCARTCNFCQSENSNPESNVCRDVNPECRMWTARGFCDSLFYPEQVKRRYCALSCGYCRSQSSPQSPRDPFDREPRPEQPFADEPTPKHHDHSPKSRKTTTPSNVSDEEFIASTTQEPIMIENDEEKEMEHKSKKKSKKVEKEDEGDSEK